MTTEAAHPVILGPHDEPQHSGAIVAVNYDDYRYVECWLDDLQLLDERLTHRPRLRSHRRSINQPPVDLGDEPMDGETFFRGWADRVQRPAGNYLQLDMQRPLTDVLPEVDAYLAAGARRPDCAATTP